MNIMILGDGFVNPKTKKIHKETATTVFTGLIINYPLNLLGLYICIDLLEWSSSVLIGSVITGYMTLVAYIRVYIIRTYYDQ